MADIDGLVASAVAAFSTLARRGSSLTTGVAVVAAVVVGLAYLVGLAALGGGSRTVWAVVGGAGLLMAVGAPLLATFRLRLIPRRSARLVSELHTLLGRNEDAKRVIIDTVEAEPDAAASVSSRGGFAAGGIGGTRTPAVMMQFQRFSSLSDFATSDDTRNIANVARTIGSLPALVFTGIALTGVGAFLGFIFLLIWIF